MDTKLAGLVFWALQVIKNALSTHQVDHVESGKVSHTLTYLRDLLPDSTSDLVIFIQPEHTNIIDGPQTGSDNNGYVLFHCIVGDHHPVLSLILQTSP